MIRYPFDEQRVRVEIANLSPNWLRRAEKRRKKILALGRYEERSAIWSEIKPVYMRLQHSKCIYCERQLEDEEFGPIEHDMEHFRPKVTVQAGPVPGRHCYEFSTGDATGEGYYWLAYDLCNYCAACKVCNTIFKLNWFPVGANRLDPSTVPTITQLAAEEPLLCYPLGTLDDDPEDLISFQGTIAVPKHSAGKKNQRARVIIDFFGLNQRDQLHRERARMICLFGYALEKRELGCADKGDLILLSKITSPSWPHSACVRAFARTWENDPAVAVQVFQDCKAYIANRR